MAMQASVENSILAALRNISDSPRKDTSVHSAGSSVYDRGGRYKIVPSQRQKRKLIDINAGHTYTVRKTYKDTISWRCSMRNKSTYCRATVLQTGKTFRKGTHDHIHPPLLSAAEFMQRGKTPRKRARGRSRQPIQLGGAAVAEDVHEVQDVVVEAAEVPFAHDIATIATSLGLLRGEENTAAENIGPIHVGPEVSITATAFQHVEGSAGQNHPEQQDSSTGAQEEDRSIAHSPSQRLETEIHLRADPSELEVGLTEPVLDQVMESSEKDMEGHQGNDSCRAKYSIVNCCTQRRQPKLIDSAGFSYTRKKANKYCTIWRCSVRNKNNCCGAAVIQSGDTFRKGSKEHNHPSKPGVEVAAKIVAHVKMKAWQQPSEPTTNIVGEALLENLGYYQPSPGLPKPSNLARAANRLKQNMRSRRAQDLRDEAIPADFLQKVVKRGDKSHIILASPQQLHLLGQATQWYIDIDSKVVKAPLKQLVSIHAFMEKDKETKQVPMVFILMSSKKKKDYKAIFTVLKDCLSTEVPVEECILTYEASLWRAITDVFPGMQCSGTALHWSQAIWRKIQDFGIEQRYLYQHTKSYKLLRRLLALPFLPAELIPRMVSKLHQKANAGIMFQLLNYIEATWIEGPTCMWSPSIWSVYMQPFRISADLEDWHLRLSTPPLSTLVMHLFGESQTVTATSKLSSKRQLKRHHRMANRNHQVVKFWEEFQRGDRKLKQLLNACATLYGPESYVI